MSADFRRTALLELPFNRNFAFAAPPSSGCFGVWLVGSLSPPPPQPPFATDAPCPTRRKACVTSEWASTAEPRLLLGAAQVSSCPAVDSQVDQKKCSPSHCIIPKPIESTVRLLKMQGSGDARRLCCWRWNNRPPTLDSARRYATLPPPCAAPRDQTVFNPEMPQTLLERLPTMFPELYSLNLSFPTPPSY